MNVIQVMNAAQVKNVSVMCNKKFSNLTDQELRFQISCKEELLAKLETKLVKTPEEVNKLERIKEELDVLLKQSHIPFRLTNTVWFNRPASIFFSIKSSN